MHTSAVIVEAILEAANHTNTMMWIGRMEDCPLELASQVQLFLQNIQTQKKISSFFWKINSPTHSRENFVLKGVTS